MPTPLPITDRPIRLDAPSTLVWEHDSGVRGDLDITCAPDMYFKSDYCTGDKRDLVMGGDTARDVLVALITALDSSQLDRPLDVPR